MFSEREINDLRVIFLPSGREEEAPSLPLSVAADASMITPSLWLKAASRPPAAAIAGEDDEEGPPLLDFAGLRIGDVLIITLGLFFNRKFSVGFQLSSILRDSFMALSIESSFSFVCLLLLFLAEVPASAESLVVVSGAVGFRANAASFCSISISAISLLHIHNTIHIFEDSQRSEH